jgi:hypothetical protein
MWRSVVRLATTSRCWSTLRPGTGARLSVLVVHDDAHREYAYRPALGLPNTEVGTMSQAIYEMAKKQGWTIVSMKTDWKCIFSSEK